MGCPRWLGALGWMVAAVCAAFLPERSIRADEPPPKRLFGSATDGAPSPRTRMPLRFEYTRGPGAEGCPDEATVHAAIGVQLGYDPMVTGAAERLRGAITREGGAAARPASTRVRSVGNESRDGCGLSARAHVDREQGQSNHPAASGSTALGAYVAAPTDAAIALAGELLQVKDWTSLR